MRRHLFHDSDLLGSGERTKRLFIDVEWDAGEEVSLEIYDREGCTYTLKSLPRADELAIREMIDDERKEQQAYVMDDREGA